MVGATSWPHATGAAQPTNTLTLARRPFHDWLLPFDIVSALLLPAVIRCVFLAKEDAPPSFEPDFVKVP